jgi:nitroreductase
MAPEVPSAVQALLSRRSVPALQLCEPGPSAAELDVAIDAALSAPDHGALKPLRFVLVRGAARARLSELFVRRMLEREPATPPNKVDKARRMPLTAPLVIAVRARVLAQHKVPEIEQLLAVGAGVMNLLNAFHAQGYGAIWLTGGNAYDAQIAQALQFPADERCLGFVYVGSIAAAGNAGPRRVDRSSVVRDWGG